MKVCVKTALARSDVTIEYPEAYTHPFTVRVNQRIMLDSELIEFVCQENERSSAHYEP